MSEITDESTGRYVEVEEGSLKTTLYVNDAGSGPAVVMLHGGGPGANGWGNFYRNFEPFVDVGFRVLLIDCPGFGRSAPMITSEPFDQVNAKAIRGVMRALDIERVHLVGNSLGGASAINFTLDHPDLVGRLVVMGPAGMGQSVFTPLPMEGIKSLGRVYMNPSMETLNEMLEVFVYDSSLITEELRETRLAAILRNDGEHLTNAIQSMQQQRQNVHDLSRRLSEITVPTLATHGMNDRMVPMDHALKVVASIPDCRLVVFNRCGHWVQWECADEFNRLVIDFLRR